MSRTHFPSQAIVDTIKREYPTGTRVVLDHMNDPYSNLPSGLKGVVTGVDDIGTIFVRWENGSRLGVVLGEDICHKIT